MKDIKSKNVYNLSRLFPLCVMNGQRIEGWVSPLKAAEVQRRIEVCGDLLDTAGGHGALPSSSPLGRSAAQEQDVVREDSGENMTNIEISHLWLERNMCKVRRAKLMAVYFQITQRFILKLQYCCVFFFPIQPGVYQISLYVNHCAIKMMELWITCIKLRTSQETYHGLISLRIFLLSMNY